MTTTSIIFISISFIAIIAFVLWLAYEIKHAPSLEETTDAWHNECVKIRQHADTMTNCNNH